VEAHAFNPSSWEAEAGRFLSSRPAWSTNYKVISRTVKAIQRNPVKKKERRKERKKERKKEREKERKREIKRKLPLRH
jgi:hypothetical protein